MGPSSVSASSLIRALAIQQYILYNILLFWMWKMAILFKLFWWTADLGLFFPCMPWNDSFLSCHCSYLSECMCLALILHKSICCTPRKYIPVIYQFLWIPITIAPDKALFPTENWYFVLFLNKNIWGLLMSTHNLFCQEIRKNIMWKPPIICEIKKIQYLCGWKTAPDL